MGDKCIDRNNMCNNDNKILHNIINGYKKICGNKYCKLLLSSDSSAFISTIKKYINNTIIYKEKYKIIHSRRINENCNYSNSIYYKLLGDIELLSNSNFLILSPFSTFSLLILYNNKILKNKSNYYFINNNCNIYDPLYKEMKKKKEKCLSLFNKI